MIVDSEIKNSATDTDTRSVAASPGDLSSASWPKISKSRKRRGISSGGGGGYDEPLSPRAVSRSTFTHIRVRSFLICKSTNSTVQTTDNDDQVNKTKRELNLDHINDNLWDQVPRKRNLLHGWYFFYWCHQSLALSGGGLLLLFIQISWIVIVTRKWIIGELI